MTRRPAVLFCAAVIAASTALTSAHASPVSVEGEVLDVVATILDVHPQVVDIAAQTPQGTEITLGTDVLFAFGSAELPPQADTLLAGLIERASTSPGRIVIAGHTDGIGDDTSNQVLSEQRARAVSEYIGGRVRGAFLESAGYGEGQPLVPELTAAGEDDPAARATNRRVTITLYGA